MVFVDVEDVVVSFLEGRPEFAAIAVGVALPPDFDGEQWVVVTRYGGLVVADDGLDHAIVRLDAYGADKPGAHAVANAVRAVLPLLSQLSNLSAVVLRDVDEIQGPYWSPDRDHARASRYLLRYRLSLAVASSAATTVGSAVGAAVA